MSRIRDVLRKAGREQNGSNHEIAGEPGTDEYGIDPHGDASPWTLDELPTPEPDGHGIERVRGAEGWELAHGRDAATRALAAGRGAGRPPTPPSRDLQQYGDILRRRWTTGLALFLVVVTGISAGALLHTPTYKASGLLEIRRDSTGTAPMQALFSSERVASDDLETQFGILRSETMAKRVVALLTAAVPAGVSATEAQLTPEALQNTLRVTPKTGSRLVEVSFESTNPTLSAWVVNAVLDTYLQMRREEARQSADWLDQQLRGARERLETSEAQLQALLRKHSLEVLETGKGETAQVVNARLQTLHEALSVAQADRIEKQASAEQGSQRAATRDLDSPVLRDLNLRLADLQRERGKLAAAFHDDYPSVKAVDSQIAEVEHAIDRESTLVVSRSQRDFQSALRRESLARQVLEKQSAQVQGIEQGSTPSSGYEALKREVVTNQAQYAVLDQKLKEVSISAALKAANVGIVDRANPAAPSPGSSPLTTIALSAIVGLILGAGGMLLQEHLDTSMRSVQDVDTYLGVPTLAAIPGIGGRGRLAAAGRRLIDEGGPDRSPLAEAFAALRTAVLLSDDTSGPRALLVTSANAAEGKTTVAVNLAVSLARLDHRVLLIDANMRDPSVQAALELTGKKHLVEALAEGTDWRSCVQTDVQKNLDVLAGSRPDASPADLLALPRMRNLVTHAADEYDFVVIDSPALLAHPADVHSLASLADSVLLTVRQGVTPRAEVALALSQLHRVSGVVLNGFHSRDVLVPRRSSDAAA